MIRATHDVGREVAPPHRAPLMLKDVVAFVAMNGLAREVSACVNVCTDMRANAELWERVVDVPHTAVTGVPRRRTQLFHWAASGDVERVRATLARGAKIDGRDVDGRTALYRASERDRAAVVRELLSRGADVDARPNDRVWTALLLAIVRGSEIMVRELVAGGASLEVPARDGRTPLIMAVDYGRADIASALLRAGALVDARDDSGRTALLCAHRHFAMTRELLENGADPNARGLRGRSALHLVAGRDVSATRLYLDDLAFVHTLLDHGADPDARDDSGQTAMVLAMDRGYYSCAPIVLALAGGGADVNVRDDLGRTPLIWVCQPRPWATNVTSAVEELVRRGADVNAQSATGETAVVAAAAGNVDAVRALLAAPGLVINANGWSPALAAARNGVRHRDIPQATRDEIIQLLLSVGALDR